MIHFLLDTNALLWYFWGDPRMEPVKGLIEMPDAKVFISVVSWWEIAIKVRLGKLKVDLAEFEEFTKKYQFFDLPLDKSSINAYMDLPKIHNDPFDHMLIAQAITAPMRFITGDAILAKYSSVVMAV